MSKVIEMADILADFKGSMTALAENPSPYLQTLMESPDGVGAFWVTKQMQGSWTYIDVDVDKAHRDVESLLTAVLVAGVAVHVKISADLEVWITRHSISERLSAAATAATLASSLWTALLDTTHQKPKGRTVSDLDAGHMRLKAVQVLCDVVTIINDVQRMQK